MAYLSLKLASEAGQLPQVSAMKSTIFPPHHKGSPWSPAYMWINISTVPILSIYFLNAYFALCTAAA